MSAKGNEHGGGFSLPGFHALESVLHGAGKQASINIPLWAIATPFLSAIIIFFLFAPEQSMHNFSLVIFISPIWLPWLLGNVAWHRWVEARRYAWYLKQPTVVLEIRVPRDTRKTPLAMEAFFSNIHLAPGEGNWYKKYWLGRVRPWYSFEFVSLGGRVHLYVWTRVTFRHVIETYLYAQYPGVEVIEVPDYTRLTDPTGPDYDMWGCEYEKKAANPYPIKTYVDFGLDKVPAPKPEEVTDPIGNIIEFMGSLGPNEQLWIHIMIRYSKGDKSGKKWEIAGREEIENIRNKTVKKTAYTDVFTGERRETDGFPNPTKGEMETMAAIGRNTDKLAYDVGIRAVYMAKKGHSRDHIGNFVTQIFRPFGTVGQSLGPIGSRWSEMFNDYPWEDPKGKLRKHVMHELLEFARRRAYFHYPYIGPWMVMSTEELATIYHVPSSTVAAPNLPRIQSTTTEAPSNLPT